MKRVDLPGGMAAHLLTRAELTGGRRRVLLAAATESRRAGEGDLVAQMELGFAGVRALVATWTVTAPGGSEPLPTPWTDPASLDEMPVDVQDALVAAVMPLILEVMPQLDADPKSVPPSEPPATEA